MKSFAWLKIQTAFVAGAALLLAVGVRAQTANGSSTVDDSAWDRLDTRVLAQLPPTLVLRETHFTDGRSGMVKTDDRLLGRALGFDSLMGLAYDADSSEVVLPSGAPAASFDVLVTVPDAAHERLRAEIRRQTGYVARRERRASAVFFLVSKQSDAPGRRSSQPAGGAAASGKVARTGAGTTLTITLRNASITNLISDLQDYFDRPILNHTGLAGKYDINLRISAAAGMSEADAIKQAMPVQLGLELVPGQELLERLVVSKAP
jgi:uncharacterized protein (TIGR03435 family)